MRAVAYLVALGLLAGAGIAAFTAQEDARDHSERVAACLREQRAENDRVNRMLGTNLPFLAAPERCDTRRRWDQSTLMIAAILGSAGALALVGALAISARRES